MIRGGYGIFYDIIPRQTSLFGTPFVVSEPSHTNPPDINDPLFVQWPLAFPRIDRAAGVNVPTTWPNDFRTPYAQNWNLTLEKELAGMRLRGSYVGTGGRKMPFAFNINQPIPGPGLFVNKPRRFPNLTGITQQINGGSHTYHALNAEIERHFANGLMFESAFTFAKDLELNSTLDVLQANRPARGQDDRSRGDPGGEDRWPGRANELSPLAG